MKLSRRDVARTAAFAACVTLFSACSDSTVGAPAAVSATPRMVITPTPAEVVIPIAPAGDPTDLGAFTNDIVADNSIRTNTEFWDNVSHDNTAANLTCNVGFYATGNMLAGCTSEQAGSLLNQGGYTKYFGDGPTDRDAAGFMFNGDYIYSVKLAGTYAQGVSTVGYFTKEGGSYQLYPITNWGSKVLNSVEVIDTKGLDWGFYVSYEFNPTTNGCKAPTTNCSDATGGFTTVNPQQFALMLGSAPGTYMVGVEDNKLELLPNTPKYDSDYNDYMFKITVASQPDVAVCDFVTFGRLVTEMNGTKVVISGNTGGNQPGGGILNEFHIDIDGVDHHVANIDSYGPITSGPLAGLPNSRMSIGTAKNGKLVELRVWDGGEPGKGTDMVYVKIDGVVRLAAEGQFIDQGNMQYHANCRGPKK